MNLRHLRNFWTVARMGGVARAAERLNLTPQTISGQIRQLEESLGAALFMNRISEFGIVSPEFSSFIHVRTDRQQ